MKNITFLVSLILALIFTSCAKENFDNTITEVDEFTADTITYDVVNAFSFALSKFYDGQNNIIGGGAGYGTNLSHEIIGNEYKWTLSATVEDGVVVTQTFIFYTPNEDPGTYEVSEYHLDHSDDDNIDWISPDMTGEITISSLSDSIVNGTITMERIVPDTSYNYNSTLTDLINL